MKILQDGYQTWPKFGFGRFLWLPAIFSARNFCHTRKVTFFGREWLTPPLFFFKNDSMAKLTRALQKVRVSVFEMGTNINIDFMVIEKFTKFAKKTM